MAVKPTRSELRVGNTDFDVQTGQPSASDPVERESLLVYVGIPLTSWLVSLTGVLLSITPLELDELLILPPF